MPTNDPKPTKAQRRDDARAKALAMRKEQERKARRSRIVAISVLALAVLGFGGAGLYISAQNSATKAAYGKVVYGGGSDAAVAPAFADVTAPSVANADGGIPVNKDGVGHTAAGDVVVKVYFDLQCPYCRRLDAANAGELERLAAASGVTIEYRPITFLDDRSMGTSYSTRAANAVAIVADKDPQHFTKFVAALFAEQPAENTKGLKDAEIASIARGVGVPSSVTDTFTDTVEGTFQTKDSAGATASRDGEWRTLAPWLAAATARATLDMGDQPGTPFVTIDGTEFTGSLYTTGPLTDAVNAALAAKKA